MPDYSGVFTSQYMAGGSRVPLPACKTGYSVGPTAADDGNPMTILYTTWGYGFSYFSDGGFLKDADDSFWYMGRYSSYIWIENYHTDTLVKDSYSVPVPAQWSGISASHSGRIFFRKSNSVFDFIVSIPSGGTYYTQHYTWTIGDAALAYVGQYTLSQNPQHQTLIGNTFYEITFPTTTSALIHAYSLDGASSTTRTIAFRPAVYHTGDHLMLARLTAEITATKDCT